MKIQIEFNEQLDKCGKEYLNERDILVTFERQETGYTLIEFEGREFFVRTNEFYQLITTLAPLTGLQESNTYSDNQL